SAGLPADCPNLAQGDPGFLDLGLSKSRLKENDVDLDGNPLSDPADLSEPTLGKLTFGTAGNHESRYCPAQNLAYTESFRYRIRDSFYQKAEATVTIHVGGGTCPVDSLPPTPQDDSL